MPKTPRVSGGEGIRAGPAGLFSSSHHATVGSRSSLSIQQACGADPLDAVSPGSGHSTQQTRPLPGHITASSPALVGRLTSCANGCGQQPGERRGGAGRMLGSRATPTGQPEPSWAGWLPGLHGDVRGNRGGRREERPLLIDLAPVRFNPD